MASMFLRQEYGLTFDEKHRDNHGAYLRSWVEALKKNPDELYLAASEAEKAVRYIRENMLERGLKKAKEKDVGNVVNAARSDVPELDNITKRGVKAMNKIAYIRQAVEKAINPKEKAPKRKILCRTKQSNKEKSQSLGTGQERMLLLQNES